MKMSHNNIGYSDFLSNSFQFQIVQFSSSKFQYASSVSSLPVCAFVPFGDSILVYIASAEIDVAEHSYLPQASEFSVGTRRINLCIGRSISTIVPASLLDVSVTLRTLPSRLGFAVFTIASFHLPLIALLSCTRTTSPFNKFRSVVCHFGCRIRLGKTSLVHLFQNAEITLCVKLNLWHEVTFSSIAHWGTSEDDLPKSKSLGHKYDSSLGWEGWRPMGL